MATPIKVVAETAKAIYDSHANDKPGLVIAALQDLSGMRISRVCQFIYTMCMLHY
jgi:hypothetical protein